MGFGLPNPDVTGAARAAQGQEQGNGQRQRMISKHLNYLLGWERRTLGASRGEAYL